MNIPNKTGKDMVAVKYSDSLGEHEFSYHDFVYSNDNYGGNQNQTVFEVTNTGGNYIKAELLATDGKTYEIDLDAIKLTFSGSMENNDFLQALRLITNAEKMVDLFNGGNSYALQEQS